MNGRTTLTWLVAFFCALVFSTLAGASIPVINTWYGPNQTFSANGQPHEWVNILGKVTDPDGISTLTYSLNGSAEQPLGVGPDSFRLWNNGDFNVEIAYADLQVGMNSIVITATDTLGNVATDTVTATYAGVNVWPRSYSIDWSTVLNINDVAQVTDGLWWVDQVASTVRTDINELGYDRLIAIGDVTWDNYEVTVPVTVHGLDPICVGDINGGLCGGGPKMGLLMRWIGHFAQFSGQQPAVGWQRLGAIGWMGWRSNDLTIDYLGMMDADGNWYDRQNAVDLPFGVTHIMKMRAETDASGHTFSLKLWPQGQVEPAGWNIIAAQPFQTNVLSQGSFLLVAHHVDVSFGNVTVTPLTTDVTAPVISNIQVAAGDTRATVSWNTDELANSQVASGPSSLYENGVISDGFYVSDHSLTIENLTPLTTYHYQVTSVDGSGNSSSSADLTFTTSNNPAGISADQFDAPVLDSSIWTFQNPAGDSSSVSMTGTQMAISMPAGVSHDLWLGENLAPRIMQTALDVDFELEAKFDTALTTQFQVEGIIVEQDTNNFIRFDFYSDGANTSIFSASFVNGLPTTQIDSVIAGGNPLYLRVTRQGDQWTVSHSYNGSSWLVAGTFSHALNIKSVGLFGANSGASPPANTVLVDYFVLNTGSSVLPPSIDTQPLSQTVAEGQSATFSVVASGSSPLSYQWQKDGVDIAAATSASYTTPATVAGDDGATYRVVVTNAVGTATSAAATLTLNLAPTITTDPADQAVNEGQTATFSVVAAGAAPLSYQWQKDGVDIAAATSASYTTPATVAGDNGATYQVVVTNSVNTVTSAAATLTLNLAPTITTPPANQSVVEGQTAAFSVVAAGAAPLSYQWQKDGVDIGGATSASYTTPATGLADDGSTYQVVVTNAVNSVTSTAATLTVTPVPVPPSITTGPADQTVDGGQTASFSVVAAGTAPLSYQWQKDGVDIAAATSASYTTPATVAGDDGATYRVVVTNAVGTATSAAATLTLNLAPTITTPPANQSVVEGQTAAFSVVAAGAAPLSYQWQKNGVDIAGATSDTYTTPATVLADNGATYQVVVSNVVNNPTSSAATLTVSAPGVPGAPGGGGGGGCTLNASGATQDPTLPLLMLISAGYLFRRRSVRRNKS